MSVIKFVKMDGAGNDFILIDSKFNQNIDLSPSLIQKMCNRRRGIGADGVLFIESSETDDFILHYYNSDGYPGSLCGNGARCSLKYAFENIIPEKSVSHFSCSGEKYVGTRDDEGNITFHFHDPTNMKLDILISVEDGLINGNFVDTGSPHAVIYWNEIIPFCKGTFSDFNIIDFGRKVRYSETFRTEGTNVNIVKFEENKIYMRTYERGVENETLACGTGAVASAIISALKFDLKSPIDIVTFGEDHLRINFEKNSDDFSKITLTGPSKINYIGSYNF